MNGVSVEKIPTIKFVGAEIKRLTKLMQFVVNDMFHNNYLFRFSQKNLLRIFICSSTPTHLFRHKEIFLARIMVPFNQTKN